jgi:hypothetical protein
MFTPLLHKDAIDSTVCSHKKAVPNLFTILFKGHSWINPWDCIYFMTVLSVKGLMNPGAEFNATMGFIIRSSNSKPKSRGGEK